MEQWIQEGLSRILDFEVPDDLIQYILSIHNEGDLNEYMKTLLDFDNNQHRNFFLELTKRKFPSKGSSLPKQQKKKISKNKQQDISSDTKPPAAADFSNESDLKNKKKTKYVNLYSQEGKNAQVVLLKGRHRCDCQAAKHDLVNNCVQCGRIVCSQEGSGPCLFCGNLASARLMESLLERNRPEGWENAVLHRNRLLEYDRTSVWLNSSEKEKLDKYQQSLHEKKHAIREMTAASGGASKLLQPDLYVGVPTDRDVAPGVNAPLLQVYEVLLQPDLYFDPSVETQSIVSVVKTVSLSQYPRVQDTELQEMSDTGRCLHEGRTWYTSHRGRLWIASTVKPPDQEVARALENQYRVLYPAGFPLCRTGRFAENRRPDKVFTLYRIRLEKNASRMTRGEHGRGERGDGYRHKLVHITPVRWFYRNFAVTKRSVPGRGERQSLRVHLLEPDALDKTIHYAAQKSIQKMAKLQAQQANAA
ncbi:putative regulation of transcription [Operophtera brumata]|uniref:Putative regulation of transcription n=1 Tax=Operophtera brumata TaxID=104452 RepID=A0A0L7LPK0_OPEBR|nr:putative regulation of transcription [Operophtera brumata]